MTKKRPGLRDNQANTKKSNQKAKVGEKAELEAKKAAQKLKKSAVNSSDSDSDSEEEDNGKVISLEGNIDNKEEIEEFTFEFFDMQESYVESITSLLKPLFCNPSVSYNIASAIVKQTTVGTAVLCEGGDDVFAFSTMLCNSCSKSSESLTKLFGDILKAIDENPAISKETRDVFKNCLVGSNAESTGTFIHRRYSNFPIQLVSALYSNLFEDVKWVKDQKETAPPQDSADIDDLSMGEFKKMTHCILLNTCSVEGLQLADNKAMEVQGSVLYDDFEDDVFAQHATASLLYKIPYSKCIVFASVVPYSKFKSAVDEVAKMCPQ